MGDVIVGAGQLAGSGVYAARDFIAGETVLDYQLQPIGEAEYSRLSATEALFVHSYGGRRYLYPAPARFVNHSDDPSCYQDFDRCRDVAVRPIAAGEPITIDATEETGRELATFLDAYQRALAARSGETLSALVAEDARWWGRGRAERGRAGVVSELLECGHMGLTAIEWMVGTGRWEALCSARATAGSDSYHLSVLLKVIAGNWQIAYQHQG